MSNEWGGVEYIQPVGSGERKIKPET